MKYEKMKYEKRKKGYSLLELMLVLVIAAGLVISAFYLYDKIKMHYQAQALQTKLSEVIANYRALSSSGNHINDKHSNNAELNDYLVGNIFKKTSDNTYTFEGNAITLNNANTSWTTKTNGYATSYLSISLSLNNDVCSRLVYPLLEQKQAVVDLITTTYASSGTNYPPSETGIITNYSVADITKSCQVFDSIGYSMITLYIYG